MTQMKKLNNDLEIVNIWNTTKNRKQQHLTKLLDKRKTLEKVKNGGHCKNGENGWNEMKSLETLG